MNDPHDRPPYGATMPMLLSNECSSSANRTFVGGVHPTVLNHAGATQRGDGTPVRDDDSESAHRTHGAGSSWRPFLGNTPWSCSITVMLMLENVFCLLLPLATGFAINQQILGSTRGVLALSATAMLFATAMMIRKRYHMRGCRRLRSDLAIRLAHDACRSSVTGLQLEARQTLFTCSGTFLERGLPQGIRAACWASGSLIMLSGYDWTLLPLCFTLFIPAALACLNASRDTQCLVSSTANLDDTAARAAPRLLGTMYTFSFAVLGVAMLQYSSRPEVLSGDIVAVSGYVVMFAFGLSQFPALMQQLARLKQLHFRARLAASTSPHGRI